MIVKVINKSEYPLPIYGKKGNSGMDIRANISNPIELSPLERVLIPTGLYFDLPENTELQVRSRSGLSLKKGLIVLNSPGTIDECYTGELGIIIANFSNTSQIIEPGERIAQIVLTKVEYMELEKVDKITKKTERGEKGYGSSGRF